jgi:hypothetical protein
MTSNQKSVVYKPVGLEAIVYSQIFKIFAMKVWHHYRKKELNSVITLASISDN